MGRGGKASTPAGTTWLERKANGSGAHIRHAAQDILQLVEATACVAVGQAGRVQRKLAVIISVGITHDLETAGQVRVRVLDLSIPGTLEPYMPAIAARFKAASSGLH